jgi:hypothetical protein
MFRFPLSRTLDSRIERLVEDRLHESDQDFAFADNPLNDAERRAIDVIAGIPPRESPEGLSDINPPLTAWNDTDDQLVGNLVAEVRYRSGASRKFEIREGRDGKYRIRFRTPAGHVLRIKRAFPDQVAARAALGPLVRSQGAGFGIEEIWWFANVEVESTSSVGDSASHADDVVDPGQ